MTFYCPIRQEMLNLGTNCCKLLKVNQAAEREVSSTVKQDLFLAFHAGGCLLLHESSAESSLLSFSNKQPPVSSDFCVA